MAGAYVPSPFNFDFSTHCLPISSKPGKAHSSLWSGETAKVQLKTLKGNYNKNKKQTKKIPSQHKSALWASKSQARTDQEGLPGSPGERQIKVCLSTAARRPTAPVPLASLPLPPLRKVGPACGREERPPWGLSTHSQPRDDLPPNRASASAWPRLHSVSVYTSSSNRFQNILRTLKSYFKWKLLQHLKITKR